MVTEMAKKTCQYHNGIPNPNIAEQQSLFHSSTTHYDYLIYSNIVLQCFGLSAFTSNWSTVRKWNMDDIFIVCSRARIGCSGSLGHLGCADMPGSSSPVHRCRLCCTPSSRRRGLFSPDGTNPVTRPTIII